MLTLLDTHLLLWAAAGSDRLPAQAQLLIEDPDRPCVFSVVSLWEIVVKNAIGRADFSVDPRALRNGLLANGYVELDVRAQHALALADLPALHRDPFDRMLVAQARAEGMTLLTVDHQVADYGDSVRLLHS